MKKPVVWLHEHFEIKKSTIKGAGKGLFAKELLRAGDTVGHYTGKILTDRQANRMPYVDSDYMLWVCTDCNILGEGALANYTRFINHSDHPNAMIVTSTRWKKARIEVLKRISPGAEILMDYGPDYWEAKTYNAGIE